MAGLVHEQKQDKSYREWPAPELGVNPNHQQHGAAGLQQDREKLQEREQNKFQFREELCDHDANHGYRTKRFFQTAPSGLGLRRLELRSFGLNIHCRKLDRRIVKFVKSFTEIVEHIAWKQRLFARLPTKDRNLGSPPARPRAESGRIVKRYTLTNHDSESTGENGSHPGGRHSWIGRGRIAERLVPYAH